MEALPRLLSIIICGALLAACLVPGAQARTAPSGEPPLQPCWVPWVRVCVEHMGFVMTRVQVRSLCRTHAMRADSSLQQHPNNGGHSSLPALACSVRRED